MKKLLFILVIITSNINTVNSQTWQWARRCGSDDGGGLNDIVVDKAGNTYSLLTLGGVSSRVLATSNNIPADDISITRYGAGDAVIVSYDKCGKLRWYKVIGTAGNDVGVNIGIDSLANVYATLWIDNVNLKVGNDTTLPNSKVKTMAIVKYDSTGNYKWVKQPNPDTASYSANIDFRIYASTTTKEGDTYIFCHTGTGLISGSTNLVATQKGYYILKYNSNGMPKELTKLDITLDEELYLSPELLRFHRTNSGKYILGVTGLDYFYTTTPSYFGNQKVNTTSVIGYFDKNGSFLWKINNADSAKYAGGLTYWDEDRKLLYIGGTIQNKETYLGYTAQAASISNYGYSMLACVDTNGQKKWISVSLLPSNIFNSFGSSLGKCVTTQNNKVVSGGSTNGAIIWGSNNFNQGGITQGYIAAFDANTGVITNFDTVRDAGGTSYVTVYATDSSNNIYTSVNYRDHLFVGSQDMYATSSLGGMCIAKWGFADCTVTPLKFLEYSVTNNNNRVNNTWSTANEVNVSRFNVQRSINGKDFTTIGKVEAYNKTSNEYRYTDNRLPLTVDGKLYYRIAAVDNDGKLTYSEVRQLAMSKEQLAVSIYPNPAKDVVHIESKEAIQQLLIIDYLGRTVKQLKVNNEKLIVDVKDLPKGFYTLQIFTSKGNVLNEKLIVE